MGREAVIRDYGGVSAQERRDMRRRRLIDAGRTLWGNEGLNAVSVRGVCTAAGLTHRYFYEHFSGREELLVAVAGQVREELVQMMLDQSTATGGSVDQRFRAALTMYLHAFCEDPQFHRIMTTDKTGIAGLETWEHETLDLIADSMVKFGAEVPGVEIPGDSESRRRARFVVGGVNRLIAGWLVEQDTTAAELAQACTDYCMALVRVPAPPER
ncbi:TetR/AcrR family transcriptional regulator [Gordonia caeni]|uniref:TetR/AcrR family transcriptional regulator n=1 Tax=Gordonia caeni TaxID=1007097 RepID=A0ABP7P6X6_9ACTN